MSPCAQNDFYSSSRAVVVVVWKAGEGMVVGQQHSMRMMSRGPLTAAHDRKIYLSLTRRCSS